MTSPPGSPTRRILLLALAAAAALGAALAGCGIAAAPGPAAPAPAPSITRAPTEDVAPGTMVMIIRHGEKPAGSESGLDADGQPDSSGMTPTGWQRARSLVGIFGPARGAPRPGLARPVAIYAAGANEGGAGLRTRQTIAPLADALGISVNTSFGKGDEEALIAQVASQPGPTLICWQHGEIPAIAEAFGSVTPAPPSEWPDDRFDIIWTLTKTTDGWHFAQLPEQALPQDRATTIED